MVTWRCQLKKMLIVIIALSITVVSFAEENLVYPVKTIPLLPYKTAINDIEAWVQAGTPLHVLASDSFYYYVKTEDGKEGYILKNQVTNDPTTIKHNRDTKASTQEYKKLKQINVAPKFAIEVLDAPGFNGNKIAKASLGDNLIVIGTKGYWYRVKIKGQEGWVAHSWVTDDPKEIRSLKRKQREQEKQKAEKERLEKERRKKLEKEYAYEKQKEEQKRREGYQLRLLGWNWHSEHGYAIAQGQVKNISNKRILYIKVVVSWFDKNKNLISYNTSYVEYTSLMPNQVTPFKVSEDFNPLMESAGINFTVEGSIVPWYKD